FADSFLINISKTDVSCNGNADGSIDLAVEGSGSFLFLWTGINNFKSSSENISGLKAGRYDVTVTAVSTGISLDTFVDISEPPVVPQPVINVSDSLAFCEGDSVTLSTGGYLTYLWSNGDTTSSINVNTTGSYSVIVNDENGCFANSDTIGVTVYSSPSPPQ